jgi:hypothetical protein
VKVRDHLIELAAIEPRPTHSAMAEVAEIDRGLPALWQTLARLFDHLGSLFPMRGLFSSLGIGCSLPRMS